MQSIDAPADLSPEARLCEIAAILARGVLRMRRTLESPRESSAEHLDLPRETVLSVQRG
jgi:hypothetical protein